MLGIVAFFVHVGLLPPAPTPPLPPPAPVVQPASYPFKVGETLRYTATLGYFPVGSASLAVARMAQERGAETFVLTMNGQGGPPGLGLTYQATSWLGTQDFTSRRFHRRVTQSGQVTDNRYVILPDSARYREEGSSKAWATPRDALDEVAFIYFLRTTPLAVGKTYTWARYFRTEFNPVQVQVTGRETMQLPTGESRPCLVLHVITRGGASDLWLTDDARRLPVRAQVPLSFGTVTLQLSGMGA
jgi:hypothetical protein